jgi:acyl-CoA thioester hydrolase|tara:strand:+ start:1720 stop:2166 length:447 start_codon:yes stop_codon:yes gene_type:complete
VNDKLTNSVTPQPWRLLKRVLPQHTDHAGVMWHGAYVAWLEEARVEALAAAGLSYSAMADMGLEMPVVAMTLEYRRSIRHGDQIVLDSCCGSQSGARWPWTSRFLLDGRVMAEARVELVILGEGRLLRRPPEAIRPALAALQKGPIQP